MPWTGYNDFCEEDLNKCDEPPTQNKTNIIPTLEHICVKGELERLLFPLDLCSH